MWCVPVSCVCRNVCVGVSKCRGVYTWVCVYIRVQLWVCSVNRVYACVRVGVRMCTCGACAFMCVEMGGCACTGGSRCEHARVRVSVSACVCLCGWECVLSCVCSLSGVFVSPRGSWACTRETGSFCVSLCRAQNACAAQRVVPGAGPARGDPEAGRRPQPAGCHLSPVPRLSSQVSPTGACVRLSDECTACEDISPTHSAVHARDSVFPAQQPGERTRLAGRGADAEHPDPSLCLVLQGRSCLLPGGSPPHSHLAPAGHPPPSPELRDTRPVAVFVDHARQDACLCAPTHGRRGSRPHPPTPPGPGEPPGT